MIRCSLPGGSRRGWSSRRRPARLRARGDVERAPDRAEHTLRALIRAAKKKPETPTPLEPSSRRNAVIALSPKGVNAPRPAAVSGRPRPQPAPGPPEAVDRGRDTRVDLRLGGRRADAVHVAPSLLRDSGRGRELPGPEPRDRLLHLGSDPAPRARASAGRLGELQRRHDRRHEHLRVVERHVRLRRLQLGERDLRRRARPAAAS